MDSVIIMGAGNTAEGEERGHLEEKKTWFQKAEFYIAAGMFLFCGILLWQILVISPSESRLLPGFTLFITGSAAVGQMAQALKKGQESKSVQEILLKKKEMAVLFMLLAAYFLFDTLGFYTTVFLLLTGITLILQLPLTRKKLLACLVYDLILIGFIYLCFAVLLGMVTPAGILI